MDHTRSYVWNIPIYILYGWDYHGLYGLYIYGLYTTFYVG